MIVKMMPMGQQVVGARTVVTAAVPTYMAKSNTSPGGARSSNTGRSFDDGHVSYDSLMSPADYARRFSEMVGAQDAMAFKHLEKLYQECRGKTIDGSSQDRLNEWLRERERRRRRLRTRDRAVSCAVATGDFARQVAEAAAASNNTNTYNSPSYLSSLNLSRQGSGKSDARSFASSCYPPAAQSRSRFGSTAGDETKSGGNNAEEAMPKSLSSALLHEKEEAVPTETQRRRIALLVTCVALAITLLAGMMVALTLGLSHFLEPSKEFESIVHAVLSIQFSLA